MMLLGGKRKKILSQEWRIWPFLTACTGTQLAFAILHMVVKDSFACVLTLFSFIGSLCCIVSRRFEVVLANVLLQVVAFFTLFICCCLGTSSMQTWHEDKKLVPLIVTQILFFAAVLILNGILLALKRRHRQHDATERNSVFGNGKNPCGGKTESSASAYPRSPKSSRAFDRVQQHREEQQAEYEQAQNQQMHSCRTHVSACVEKPCMAGVNLLHTSSAHGIARRGPPSGYVKELSSTNQEPSDHLYEDETEDDEAAHAVTMGRRAHPHVCEREWVSPHFVIRSHRIEAAGGSQRYRVPARRTTSQAFAAKLGRSSCSSATPPIRKQSLALHGRTPRSVSLGDALASDRGRRTSQGRGVPADAWSPAAEAAPVATGGGVGVFVVNHEPKKNTINVPTVLCASSPRRCSSGHFLDKSASCSCPTQTPRACPLSSASSLHSCIALSDEGTGCNADTLKRNGLPYRPPSTGEHKYFFAANLTKSVRRCWETTLNYLSQTVECDTLTDATKEKVQMLYQSDSPADATPSPTTVEHASAKVEGSRLREGETPSGDRSLDRGRRTSVNSYSPEALDGAHDTYTDLTDKRKDAGLEDRGEETREPTFSGLLPKQELATVQFPLQENKQSGIGELRSPAVPLETTVQPAESMQSNKNRDSHIGPATCTREGLILTASERGEQGGGKQEVEGHLWVAEVYTESAQETHAKQTGHKQEEGEGHSGSATPTNPSAAATLDAAPVGSNRELRSERSCPPFERIPKETELDGGNTCEGVIGTTGKQRRLPVVVPEKREQVSGYTEQSVSDEANALCGDELAVRSRSVEVLVNPVENASVVEVTKADTPCRTSQLDHTDNHSVECEAVNSHRVPAVALIKGIKSTFKGTTTPFKAGNALPLSSSFERLPAGIVAVDADSTSFHIPFNQAGAEECQLCNSGTTVTPCRQFPSVNCSSGAAGKAGGPLHTSETLGGNGFPSTDWRNERISGELFLGDEAEHTSGVSQSDPTASQCAPAVGVSATPAGEEMHKESCVCSSEGGKSSLEATATRDGIICKPSSKKTVHVELGKIVGSSCVTTDVPRVNAPAAGEATSRTGSELPGRSTRSGRNMEEVRCSVNVNAVNLPTAVATNINNMPLAVPIHIGESAVSKEKVVYRDNLTRELTLNTTPRAEEDEDSWEDESEETEGQIHDDVLAGKESERESRSEWELSDLSDAATLSENRQQGRGTQKNRKSKDNSAAESSAAFGKYSTKRRHRNHRRSR